jgi:hypothetical protein
MALLSFVDSTPPAYRLKASNAAPPISTFAGAIPVPPVADEVIENAGPGQLSSFVNVNGRETPALLTLF